MKTGEKTYFDKIYYTGCMDEQVSCWIEEIVIPTYPIGAPEKNPMFLEKRVYQGSSGVVYPHAVVEKIHDQKINKSYKAVFLENQYIRIMILPELGGRIQMAFDKVKQRHFVYYNQVIKPALVGLTGPWISGGIEFNWPQHHRPSTFEPVDFTIKENEDGSKTVWINEVERMFRTKGMAGFTLYPDKAYIEIKGKLYNRTPFPQTFLWWANPAVKVNEHYQSIFPPDVYAVFDHGKRDVSSFPIADGVYYKVDYSPGTDISKYKNIPVPTSFMAVSSKHNFIGGYEHDTQGGLLHVADHHIAPGKKQWTWGHGEFGQAWDRNLTDEDGPYIELMTGVYTDNQPDFSWLQPYEEKTFTQYFMPYREVGAIKNATKDAVVNLEVNGAEANIKLYTTSAYDKVKVTLFKSEQVLFTETISTSPEKPYLKIISFSEAAQPEEIKIVITDLDTGRQLVSYQKEFQKEQEIPEPAQPAMNPADVENNEQLYLAGLHLEQYRHATFAATDYYQEALRRDPNDARNNNAMGLWFLRRGQFPKSESYFRKAIATLTQRNPNPYDGEPFFNMGWCLKLQGKHDEAFDCFYKSAWNDAWQHAAYFNLARIATAKGNYEEALELINKSIVRNYHSHSARHAKAFILRKLNKKKEAIAFIEESLALDPFNFGCLFEKHLLLPDRKEAEIILNELKELSRNWVHNFIEYALDYAHAGLFAEAIELILAYYEDCQKPYSLVPYYLGWLTWQSGDIETAALYFEKGAKLEPDFVFASRLEEILILQKAIEINPSDYKAHYYLGNLWYDKRQYSDAIQCWEKSVLLNDKFPTTHRNLALAYYNKLNDPVKALQALEVAFGNDTSDARVLMELDQLYKRLNKDHNERLQFLEQHLQLVEQRDDLYLERITLNNQLGNYKKAKSLIAAYKFHPWEGGEGKVVGQYLMCHLELAKNAILEENYALALSLLEQAEIYPTNLGEGKLTGAQENDIHYWKGVAWEMMNDNQKANDYYRQATVGISEPVQAIFYNDPQPDKIFYQGLAWIKLNHQNKAFQMFQSLIDFGKEHIDDAISIDYFAVSLPDLLVFDADLNLRNRIHCLYLMALGNLGIGALQKAGELFDKILALDRNHQGTIVHKNMINYLSLIEH
jgi:tetratricopeptide (TPR) repeat protein